MYMRSSDLFPRERHARWAAIGVATTFVLALVPLLFNSRFYFADDTQTGALGAWYSLGEHLRAGTLPIFEPSRWMAGNYAVEGQWGIWNPAIWLLGLATTVVPNAVVLCTGIKLVFLCLASGGVFVLARSYGARPEWATTAGVLVPLTGFVVYMDSAAWVTGLFVWALLPWVWWGLRRTAFRGGNVLVPFGFGYLLVTVGYVHGTIMLIAVVVGVLVEAAVDRTRRGFVRVLLAGMLLGLVAVAVFLPGLLSAGVTLRTGDGVTNDNFLSPDLSGLAASSIATAHPWIKAFWAPPLGAPILYFSWLVPAVAFVDWRRAARLLPAMTGLLIVGVTSLALALGPSHIGPLGFPVRLIPYLALAGLVLLVVFLSHAAVRPGRGRVLGAVALLLAGWYSALAKDPPSWVQFAIALGLALGGVGAVAALLRRDARASSGVALVSVVIAFTAASTLVQHNDAGSSPLPDYHLPAPVAAYNTQLRGVTGDTIVAGLPTHEGRTPWEETLTSNAWYLNNASVQNVYTSVGYRTYAADMCLFVHGDACPEVLSKLFQTDPTTGRTIADLLSVNNIQILSLAATTTPKGRAADKSFGGVVPAGWHVSQRGETTALWSRDTPIAGAGGVAWTSPETRVTVLGQDKRNVHLRVDSVGSEGGKVTFSRLAWPGYSVNGAVQGAPVRDYLLTVDVPAGSAGRDVTVSFSPPGWHFEIGALFLAVLLAFGWGGAGRVTALIRRRRTTTENSPPLERTPAHV